jgi:hypothetical protein
VGLFGAAVRSPSMGPLAEPCSSVQRGKEIAWANRRAALATGDFKIVAVLLRLVGKHAS